MALDGDLLADEIVTAIADPAMSGEAKQIMLNTWKKICTTLVTHLTTNTEWSTVYRKVVSVTENALGVHTVEIKDPTWVQPSEFVPNPVQPVVNLIIGPNLGIK